MACTEYNCCDCKHIWFANGTKGCPECGSTNYVRFYEDRDLDKKDDMQSAGEDDVM